MHPAPAFRFESPDEMRAFVHEHAFATIAAVIDGRVVIAQAPMIVDGERFLLHLSRANPIAKAAPISVTAVVTGDDAYVSPDWYGTPDQVPTWNYVSVEIEGELTATDDEMLREILVRESAVFEGRIAGKQPWTIDKLRPETLAAKLKGIVGVVLTPRVVRGTSKLAQTKTAAERERVIAALAASPRERERNVAEAMRQRLACDDGATGPAGK
jgi:transcriptional regulator